MPARTHGGRRTMSKNKNPSPNDQRSHSKNPERPEHKSAQDNRSNPMNPNHPHSQPQTPSPGNKGDTSGGNGPPKH